MGGSDDSSNLVELSIEEHALAHKLLWEQHGNWQDEVAYKALSGQIPNAEINRVMNVLRNTGSNNHMYGKPSPMRGKTHRVDSIEKIRSARKNQVIKHSPETKEKIGLKHRGKTISQEHRDIVAKSNVTRILSPRSLESRQKSREATLNSPTVQCPRCSKVGQYSAMHRWHFDNCKVAND